MTTSDFIVCQLLGCGELDIDALFGKLTETDYFSDAVDDCKMNGFEISAGAIWESAIYNAFRDVFGDDVEFDTYFNYIDSHVSVQREVSEGIEDFSEKSYRFEELTGFDVEIWEC